MSVNASGQEIATLRRLPVGRMLPSRAVGSINSHVGINFLQNEGTDHPLMAFLSQHPSGIKLNGAEDVRLRRIANSLTCRKVWHPGKSGEEGIRHRLMIHDRVPLQRCHDLLLSQIDN
ncbi:hypothetical protein [Mesorhizobium sp. M0036]|uniref:hypothetical protein n=1 Tax=Mesorhizobium sp. M0036 TaxID=2956853 RepID=UPI00333569B8